MANKHQSPHDWASSDYVQFWAERADRELGSRQARFHLLCDLLPFEPDDTFSILELGAGFGALSEVVLERFPYAQIVCLDGSAAMLTLLRKRQVRFGNRIRIVNANYADPSWLDHLGQGHTFDAIVSSLAMHGLRERRAEMFKELYALLRPAGCFINIDLAQATSEKLRARYRKIQIARYEDHVESITGELPDEAQSVADIDGVPLGKARVERAQNWAPGDWTTDLQWLRDAGFIDVDCFWKELKSAMIGGYKAEE